MTRLDFRTLASRPSATRTNDSLAPSEVALIFGLALFGSAGCGVGTGETPAQLPEAHESELHAGSSAVTFDPAALGIVRLVVDDGDHHRDICTGTLVRNGWALTAKSCMGSSPPSDLWVEMWSTHGGPSQSSGATEIYRHPAIDAALIRLSSPFSIGGDPNYVRPLALGVPVERQVVRCFGFDGSALRSKTYLVIGRTWNFYVVDDSDRSLEFTDIGASCVTADSTSLGPIIGMVSGIGTRSVQAATAFMRGTSWVEDMINLSRLAELNHHTSNRIQSLSSFMCLDVAWASVVPYISVNQYPCHDGLNQQWYLTTAGQPWNETHFTSLVSVNSGKCLEVGPDDFLLQNNCTGANNQLFGRRFPWWQMITPDGRCVDVPGFSTVAGQHLQVYPCNGGVNQFWRTF